MTENGKITVDPPEAVDSVSLEAAPEATPDAATEPAGPDPFAVLTEERNRLAVERAELTDMLLRLRADNDNTRRRAEREKSETREFAAMEAAREMLPILDDFERALKAVPEEEGPARDYARGTELIYQRLVDTLTRLGLEAVPAAGRPFDPNVHNAILREERDDVDGEIVTEEFQRGYLFKGRLLRPAMVKVAVKVAVKP